MRTKRLHEIGEELDEQKQRAEDALAQMAPGVDVLPEELQILYSDLIFKDVVLGTQLERVLRTDRRSFSFSDPNTDTAFVDRLLPEKRPKQMFIKVEINGASYAYSIVNFRLIGSHTPVETELGDSQERYQGRVKRKIPNL